MKGGFMLSIVGVLLALFAGFYLYWQLRYPIHTYRYELTVEVETPEGLRSGSAVREITWRDGKVLIANATTAWFKERGEAVAIDLPEGETLFALIYGAIPGKTAGVAFGSARQMKSSSRELVEIKRPDRHNPVWGQDGYPRLVRFRNITDPMSVEKVDPDDLEASFGEGYSIRRITAQITDKPVVYRMERLPWLEEQQEERVRLSGKSGAMFSNELPETLGASSFSFRGHGK
jgi:hypothetical protein